jgi:hypothetical protein
VASVGVVALVRQHQCVAILRSSGWRCAMLGVWSKADGRWVREACGSALAVPRPPAGSLDHNEKGVWSALEVGPLEPGATPEAAREAEGALRVAALDRDGLSPQGAARARELALAGWLVDGPWLPVAGGDALHLGTGARRSGAAPPEVEPLPLPLDLGYPLPRDGALALLLARALALGAEPPLPR